MDQMVQLESEPHDVAEWSSGRPSFAVLFCAMLCNGVPAWAQDSNQPKAPQLTGRHVEEVVFEGVGVAGAEFGDPADFVEEVLGEADGGSENHRSYRSSGFSIGLCDGKACRFDFTSGFRGRLNASGLRIGSRIEEFERAYGIVEIREVDNLESWQLDRTLLMLRGPPRSPGAPASKLSYGDVGLSIEFDEQRCARRFTLLKRSDYAHRRGPGGQPDGRFIEQPVSEGGEFAGVRFGDTRERAIELLGEPTTRSDYFLTYRPSHVALHIRNGKVDGFLFDEGFRGTLVRSGMGIGRSLEDVETVLGGINLDDDADTDLPGGPLKQRSLSRYENLGSDLAAQYNAGYRDATVFFSIDGDGKVRRFRMFQMNHP